MRSPDVPPADGSATGSRRRLREYLATAFLARFAEEGMGVAVVLLALHRTGGAAQGASVLTAWMAPHIVAAPLAGALVARTRRPRWFYVLALGGFAVAIAVLAACLGRVPLPLTLAVAAAGGSCGPVVSGGLSSLVASLVPADGLGRAYGLDAAVYNAASVASPAVVSVVAVTLSPGPALATLAGAAGVAALLAFGLPEYRPESERGAQPAALRKDLVAGLVTVWRVPELRAITTSTTLAFVGLGGLGATAVLLAAAQGSPGAGGLLMTAFAVGALVGSLVVARWWPAVYAPRLASCCLLGLGLALAAAALTDRWPLGVALFALAGVAEGPLLSATLRIRADHSPPASRPQVFTTGAGLKISAAACGAALVGLTSEALSPGTLLLGLAVTQLAAIPLGRLARDRAR